MIDGLLIHKCDIMKMTESQTSGGQVVKAWTKVKGNIRCRLDMAKGQEVETEGSRVVKASHILFLRKMNINEKDYRIQIDGNNYNILIVSKAGGTDHHLELLLERIIQ